MITGLVKSDEGIIRLTMKGPERRQQEIKAVIDTGFTDWLTLPPDVIAALGLRWRSLERCLLADGSECLFEVYVAKIVWDGKERRVLVDQADADPLVGMSLMRGYELKMQIRSRGKVTIKRLPRLRR
jgi:clan AA aspartic protease